MRRTALLLVVLLAPLAAGCASSRPKPTAVERGMASWYGPGFHGNSTASGQRYDMWALTAAHRTLPFGTIVEVRNLENDQTVRVLINDRGPFRTRSTSRVRGGAISDRRARGRARRGRPRAQRPAYAVQVGPSRGGARQLAAACAKYPSSGFRRVWPGVQSAP
jgi:hypothetical protein